MKKWMNEEPGNGNGASPAERPAAEARQIAFVGMLGALSFVLYLLRFPMPFLAPSFMEMDFSELPALFAGFFLGPLPGLAVVLVKVILKAVIQGSQTAYVGDFSNLVMSSIFILSAAVFYKKNRTKKGAVIAMVIATLAVSVAAVFLNLFVMFPLYSRLYGMPMEAIVGMGTTVNPLIKNEFTMMVFAVFPFNFVKHALTSLITFLLYKRVANALRGIVGRR